MTSDTRASRLERILIVDDERAILEGMTIALAGDAREVVACQTFDEARQKLLAEKFDVLLTDVRLGPFNGLQLAILARDRDPEMRIVVFSGFDDSVLRAEAARARAAFILKPVTAEQLLDMMMRSL